MDSSIVFSNFGAMLPTTFPGTVTGGLGSGGLAGLSDSGSSAGTTEQLRTGGLDVGGASATVFANWPSTSLGDKAAGQLAPTSGSVLNGASVDSALDGLLDDGLDDLDGMLASGSLTK